MYTNTELHKVIATNNKEKISTYLKITPQETLYRQCHTVDFRGNIPLNLSTLNRDRETTASLSRIMKNPGLFKYILFIGFYIKSREKDNSFKKQCLPRHVHTLE